MRGILLQAAARIALYPAVLAAAAVRAAAEKVTNAVPAPPGPVRIRIQGCKFLNTQVVAAGDFNTTSRVRQIDVLLEELKDECLDFKEMLREAEIAGRRNRVRFGPCRECGKMAMYGFFEFLGPRHSKDECLARQVLEA